jgi:SAM-dependent methyltransferase
MPPKAVAASQQSQQNWLESLACPACATTLDLKGSRLHCRKCQKSWPVVDGVPHFVEQFPYWGEIPLEPMREVIRAAKAGSWKAALLNSSIPEVREASKMILNLDRANWQWLVDLPRESAVLDLGAGTGTNSRALSRRYESIVAVEPVLERIQFMQEAFKQEGISNISIARTSVWDLPFAPQSFDLVAMNGVLEWVPEGRSEDPRELQLAALRNVLRVLRPGGSLYVGIENRLSAGYFVGYRDPHCSLPWVTILPRPLAHWYARRKGMKNGYRNYLYSSSGYRKLLLEAGFSAVEIYVALPSYNFPRYFVPLQNAVFNYYSETFNSAGGSRLRGWVRRILVRTGLMKHLEYSFAIIARK